MNATTPEGRGAQSGDLPSNSRPETALLPVIRPLTIQEAGKFLRATTGVFARYAAVERLALLAGLRPSEIADLAHRGHVERRGLRWHVTVVGGKCPRTIAVAHLVGDALQDLADGRLHQHGPLYAPLPQYATLGRVVDHLGAALEDSGLGDASVHAIRGFLVKQLPKAVDPGRAYAYLGEAGTSASELPAGWDIEVAELIDQYFSLLANS
ncbi:hypothetical protein GCM10009759_04290 [Kitasatospora saccharophila]|uniref:Tyr recombinase domain-containing protein n=1 Tax=Kitasatospora saccharophila TaxID=407973 RepID=A0ABP5HRA1_9ACTN